MAWQRRHTSHVFALFEPQSARARCNRTRLFFTLIEVTMWEQYRRTFRSMQALMVVVTLVVMSWTHAWQKAAVVFVTMQIGAVLGANWGSQLKDRIRRAGDVPARRS